MKIITAIIRPEKLPDVLEALFKADVRGLTISRAQGHGGEIVQVTNYRGTTAKMELHEKVRIDIGVSEPFVDVTVQVVMNAARTGEVGDGKIFVIPRRQGLPHPYGRRGRERRHPADDRRVGLTPGRPPDRVSWAILGGRFRRKRWFLRSAGPESKRKALNRKVLPGVDPFQLDSGGI